MIQTANFEPIYEIQDLTEEFYTSLRFEILSKGFSRRYKNFFNEFMTLDIETSTIKDRSTVDQQYIGFIYSIQVAIADRVIFFHNPYTYNSFVEKLNEILSLSAEQKLVCYVHNLSFEFQYLRDFFDITSIFATEKRKIVKFSAKHIEYRCSYRLTNKSLDKLCESTPTCIHKKIDSEEHFDYKKLRLSYRDFNPMEMQYAYNDVVGLRECIQYQLDSDEYNIANIPLTSTGFVRRTMRKCMAANPENRKQFLKTRLDKYLYTFLREARRGGNTHANPIWSNKILENLKSFDMSSAYPAVMIQEKFPMGKFYPLKTLTLESVLSAIDKGYACIINWSTVDLQIKTLATVPYIAKAKCTQLRNIKGDNGRVLSADKISMCCTDIDLKIILSQYNMGEITINDCYISKYDYLPYEMRKEILQQYIHKTTLKDSDPYTYMKEKNKLNANFGMMLTDICRDEIEYNPHAEEPFTSTKSDYEQDLNRYYKSRNSFLSYQHGLWVTAHCRKRLQKAIDALGYDVVYCDTDSCKYFQSPENDAIFEKLNNEIRSTVDQCGFNCTVTYKGKEYTLGLWEEDGIYKQFKTMGAKKYAYIDEDDHFSITVAGLSKSKGRQYMEKIGGMSAFNEFTVIPKSSSGRLSAHYNDYTSVKTILVNGRPIAVGSNVVLTETEYSFSITDEYSELLQSINAELY